MGFFIFFQISRKIFCKLKNLSYINEFNVHMVRLIHGFKVKISHEIAILWRISVETNLQKFVGTERKATIGFSL